MDDLSKRLKEFKERLKSKVLIIVSKGVFHEFSKPEELKVYYPHFL
jgi:hypothetical protein